MKKLIFLVGLLFSHNSFSSESDVADASSKEFYLQLKSIENFDTQFLWANHSENVTRAPANSVQDESAVTCK